MRSKNEVERTYFECLFVQWAHSLTSAFTIVCLCVRPDIQKASSEVRSCLDVQTVDLILTLCTCPELVWTDRCDVDLIYTSSGRLIFSGGDPGLFQQLESLHQRRMDNMTFFELSRGVIKFRLPWFPPLFSNEGAVLQCEHLICSLCSAVNRTWAYVSSVCQRIKRTSTNLYYYTVYVTNIRTGTVRREREGGAEKVKNIRRKASVP